MRIIFVVCLTFLSTATFARDDCPDDSYQTYTCVCPNGEYDEELNKCINSTCPKNSVGTYPNCKCLEKNFDYSRDVNDCFRVCPEYATGYWPKCVCDDKNEGFDPSSFECISCPFDSEGGSIYPNCDCGENGTYDKEFNQCQRCWDAKGIYPNCECENRTEIYNIQINRCEYCPENCRSALPACVCENGPFEQGDVVRECPYSSTGEYPNCKCKDESKGFDKVERFCKGCWGGSTGKYPNCTCEEPSVFHLKDNKCIQCPKEATGVYPNCKCTDNEQKFSAYINKCYIPCPKGSHGIHPKCLCEENNMSYDEENRECVSSIGRECPKLSIGVGPDCLCIKYDSVREKPYEFDRNAWDCVIGGFAVSFHVQKCPDNNQHWPLCDEEISKHAVFLLVGG